ncbi:hypothetical protein PAE9249_02103 [Paenibacillus sp. CECT 9249]|nr:hypothetical protein PAE9249_02103 [Paenibacillus sp. CECT 9249]
MRNKAFTSTVADYEIDSIRSFSNKGSFIGSTLVWREYD